MQLLITEDGLFCRCVILNRSNGIEIAEKEECCGICVNIKDKFTKR